MTKFFPSRKTPLHKGGKNDSDRIISLKVDPFPLRLYYLAITFEPGHSLSYKTACAPIEDSDQPANPDILSSTSVVYLKKLGCLPIQQAQSNYSDQPAQLI